MKRWLSCIGAVLIAPPLIAHPDGENIVAEVADRAITLAELDAAGGRALYDARRGLYDARVRALYRLLAEALLAREAARRGVTVDRLIEHEVTARTAPVTDAEIDRYFAARSDLAPDNPRVRQRARSTLAIERQRDRRAAYIAALFNQHPVSVTLETPPPPPAERVAGPLNPALGPADAPVTVITFSDYLCPHCRALAETLAALRARFAGQVRLVVRHFPLGPASHHLAEAAMCAGDQHQFWTFHEAIFERRREGIGELIEGIAERLGLDRAAFDRCLESGQHAARIAADVAEGQRLGIRGTPTTYVNGVRIHGAASLGALTARIEEILARSPSLTQAKNQSPPDG